MFGWLKNMTGGARKPAPPPAPQSPPAQPDLVRACAPLIFRKPATIDPFATMFGAVRLGRKGENWPCHDGAPLWPLCQINLKAAPVVPATVRDLSVLTLFVAPNHDITPTRIIDTRAPDPAATWALRSYDRLDGLTIPQMPKTGSTLVPLLGEWGVANRETAHERAGILAQTKLGGWPASMHSEPWWAREATGDTWDFVLQIESETAAGWQGWAGDAVYIARSRERSHLWALDVKVSA